MKYDLPEWLSLAAPLSIAAVMMGGLLLAGKVPIRYSVRNLRVRWKATVLTALAFTVVVALLIFMHAFAMGITRLSEKSAQPANVICLAHGASDELYSNLPMSAAGELALQKGVVRESDGRPLCSSEVYFSASQSLPAADGRQPRSRFLQVRGVEEPDISAHVHNLELIAGTWFGKSGVRESVPGELAPSPEATLLIEAVVGEGLAHEMGRERGKTSLEPGDLISIGPRTWVLVGIMRGAASTFGSEVWAKRQLVGEVFHKKELYTSIVLQAESPAAAKTLADRLSRDFKNSAISVQTETDYFAKMADTNQQLLDSIYFVACIMALGGIFGVMNTMFATIRQRSPDIGVLRVLGFARWQVLASFLLESLLIAALGGAVGCALGCLVDGVTTTSVVETTGGGFKRVSFEMVVDGSTLAAASLFTLIMGFLGGLLPALSAMRQKPVEALR